MPRIEASTSWRDYENETLTVDVWSPLLSCSEAGTWNADQHSNELMWTYTIPDLNLGINADSFNAGHLASTQALVADLELDGSPELILSTVAESLMNAFDLKEATKIICGSARSMGIEVKE